MPCSTRTTPRSRRIRQARSGRCAPRSASCVASSSEAANPPAERGRMRQHMQRCLIWFRRDLRLTDNPALAQAVADAQRVIAVYIHAPEESDPWRPGAASNWWLNHSLAALEHDLRVRGCRLIVRAGPTLATLQSLARETGAGAVYWNRLYEPALAERDTKIEHALGESGISAQSFNAALLFEPRELLS